MTNGGIFTREKCSASKLLNTVQHYTQHYGFRLLLVMVLLDVHCDCILHHLTSAEMVPAELSYLLTSINNMGIRLFSVTLTT